MFLFASLTMMGQKTSKDKNFKLPEFKVGESVNADKSPAVESIQDYLTRNITYPELALSIAAEGVEVVMFTVTGKGELTDFQVINSVCESIDKEVIRVLKTTNGMWQPGIENNEPVTMQTEICAYFALGEVSSKNCSVYFTRKGISLLRKANKKFVNKHKPKAALALYDRAMNYCPNNPTLLLFRGLCKHELDDVTGAQKDWERMTRLGGIPVDTFHLKKEFSHLKGCNSLLSVLNGRTEH